MITHAMERDPTAKHLLLHRFKRVWFRWLDLVKDAWIAEARTVGLVIRLRTVNLKRRWAQ